MLRLCVVCKENETERLMDEGWGEMLPVCTPCLASGRYRELKPQPTEPEAEAVSESLRGMPAVTPKGMFWCTHCPGLHREGTKIGKSHLKYRAED